MSESKSLELAERLFVRTERWGWQFAPPSPLAQSPEANRAPVWHEPLVPDTSVLAHKRAKGVAAMPKRLGVTVLAWIVVSLGSATAGVFILVAGLAVSIVPVVTAGKQIKGVLQQAKAQRDAGYGEFLRAQEEWRRRIAAHEEAELARQATAMQWHPLRLESGPSRIDVFGGTGDGWASLLATLGSSMIESGSDMTVIDFSEQHVAGGLAAFVAVRGGRPVLVELPADADRFDVLGGVEPDELADLLAQAVHSMRQKGEHVDLRALDTDLLETVAGKLDGPITFRRLVAGLEVLRRTYDVAAEGPLTVVEVTRISAAIDTVGQTERVQHELQFLVSTLNLMAKDEAFDVVPGEQHGLWGSRGLHIVATAHSQHRRKDFLDRVVFQRLLHDLRGRRGGSGDSVLVVVGADEIGLAGLESLARQCSRVGVRLVLMLERLRGDLKELLGSSDSAAILMRLGNAQDAAAAAEFIGRGHKFVLSQVTAQVSSTFTKGTSQSEGRTEGETETEGSSFTKGSNWSKDADSFFAQVVGGSKSLTKSYSHTASRSRSWQDTVNQSEAEGTTDGTTQARVYEFAVEPTTVQSLAATAFVLVEAPSSGRRVVVGDCNPGITLLRRVSTVPLLTA